MSEQENQSPASQKRRRTHLAPQAGADVPVPPPEPRSSASSAEPPIGEKWGEFPPVERRTELRDLWEVWKQNQAKRPFVDRGLSGADVYWLAALVAGEGRVEVGIQALNGIVPPPLPDLHLEGANLFKAQLTGAKLREAQLTGANLFEAHLEGANLFKAQLTGTNLHFAFLKGADLNGAQLAGAILLAAHLEGADLRQADLTRQADLRWATLDAQTQLAKAKLDATILAADVAWNGAALMQVEWKGVPCLGDEAVAYQIRTEDGLHKGPDQRQSDFEAAARAYRQLAIALRGQGITDAADRFTYRALIMQRKALWLESNLPMTGFTEALAHLKTLTLPQLWKERGRFIPKWWLRSLNQWARLKAQRGWQRLRTIHPKSQLNRFWNLPAWGLGLGFLLVILAVLMSVAHWWGALLLLLITVLVVGIFSQRRGRKLLAYLFSGFLATLTGYGFRMGRIVVAYLLLICGFAAAYWDVGVNRPRDISYWTALIVSVTAFHGRVFTNPFLPNIPDAQVIITAIEAVVGLIIEGVFIAMLTQRFFNR